MATSEAVVANQRVAGGDLAVLDGRPEIPAGGSLHSGPPAGADRRRRPLAGVTSRPAVIAAVIAGCWLLVALLLGDGYLSPDTGAKIATLEAMRDGGGSSPAVGYWAAGADLDGSLHPFHQVRLGERWVAVTTLPLQYLALPLYAVAGHHGALALPIAAGVLVAFAAGALARRLGAAPAVAARAMWLTGLAGPVSVYALEVWEHTLGLALMAWGSVWALDAVRTPTRQRAALLCGLAFGAAATMRQEALVYTAIAACVVVAGAAASRRRSVVARAVVAVGAGALAPTASNMLLEVAALGAPIRSARSAATLSSATSDLGGRAAAALVTLASPVSSGDVVGLVLALALVITLVLLVRGVVAGRPVLLPAAVLAVVVAFTALFQAAVGPAFVPGLVAASPLAGAGLALATRRSTWNGRPVTAVMVLALAPVPLVWAVQHVDQGAWAQWGGRYLLLTGFLLAVVAVTLLSDRHRRLLAGLVVANVALSVLGAATVVKRTQQYEDLVDELAGRPEPVLVFRNRFLAQEAGPTALERRWLAAASPEQQWEAAQLLAGLGVERFGYVDPGEEPPRFPGYVAAGGADRVGPPGATVEVLTFRAVDG